jgi:hypothetical protein
LGSYKVPVCDHPVASRSVPTSVVGTRSVPKNLQGHVRLALISGHCARPRPGRQCAINGLMHRSKRTHAGCNASLDPASATRPARGNPTTSKAACVFMPERCRCNGASAAMNLLRLCRDECHKAIPVRHAYLRQRLGIHRVVLSDDAVELQDVGGHCIEFVIGQRLGFVVRH